MKACVLPSLVALLALAAACGGERAGVSVGDDEDDEVLDGGSFGAAPRCDRIEIDGDLVIEKEKNFTARYHMGEPYEKTFMIFGGDPVEDVDKLSNAFIFALDKDDALMLAKTYPDFYLCSSPGGQAASKLILPYDLVPASCEVYEQLVEALEEFHEHDRAGGDRTSLRIKGAPLTVESVTANSNGQDVTDQVTEQDYDFQLVTSVEKLTGKTLLSFGTTK